MSAPLYNQLVSFHANISHPAVLSVSRTFLLKGTLKNINRANIKRKSKRDLLGDPLLFEDPSLGGTRAIYSLYFSNLFIRGKEIKEPCAIKKEKIGDASFFVLDKRQITLVGINGKPLSKIYGHDLRQWPHEVLLLAHLRNVERKLRDLTGSRRLKVYPEMEPFLRMRLGALPRDKETILAAISSLNCITNVAPSKQRKQDEYNIMDSIFEDFPIGT